MPDFAQIQFEVGRLTPLGRRRVPPGRLPEQLLEKGVVPELARSRRDGPRWRPTADATCGGEARCPEGLAEPCSSGLAWMAGED